MSLMWGIDGAGKVPMMRPLQAPHRFTLLEMQQEVERTVERELIPPRRIVHAKSPRDGQGMMDLSLATGETVRIEAPFTGDHAHYPGHIQLLHTEMHAEVEHLEDIRMFLHLVFNPGHRYEPFAGGFRRSL
jgi:hypothetical protein